MIRPLLLVPVLLAYAQPARSQPTGRFEFERGLMGTTFRIIVYSADSVAAASAVRAAFASVDSLNQILSDYLPDSELSGLSKESGSGRWIPVSSDLWEVIASGQQLAVETGGAFDLTVGSLTRLWRHAMRRKEMPDSSTIEQARAVIGFRYVEMDTAGRMIRLSRPGMRLDAGGIAKGYAVDEAFGALIDAGLDQVLVDGGGDLRVGAPPPGRKGWDIAVTTVDSTGGRSRQIVSLSQSAVATSGSTYRFLEVAGVRYSHILDPKTGLGLTREREVTVFAPSCKLADALSTALSVTDIDDSRSLVNRYQGIRARIVEADSAGYRLTDIPIQQQ